MQQMPYWAITSSSAKPAGPSMYPPRFPILTLSPHTAPSSRVRFLSRIPWWLTQRMILNLAVATSIGLVPFLGDVLLAAYRANSRNAALLEEFLRHRGEGTTRTTAETSAPADEGIGVRDERSVHEADQDLDDSVTVPLERKRSGLSQKGTGGFLDDKGESLGAPQPVRHRDSRFIEDVT